MTPEMHHELMTALIGFKKETGILQELKKLNDNVINLHLVIEEQKELLQKFLNKGNGVVVSQTRKK